MTRVHWGEAIPCALAVLAVLGLLVEVAWLVTRGM